jgi:probable HAF family extracellular repeat protein
VAGPQVVPQNNSAVDALSVNVGDNYALGIDDEGWVVGWSVPDDLAHPHQDRPHAVIWLPKGGGMIDLASFAPPSDYSLGLGISDGRAVGNDVDGPLGSSARGDYAALWSTHGQRRVDLSAGKDSSARDINVHGQVAGWTTTGKGGRRACVWLAGTHKQVVLGTLHGDYSIANATNDKGQVVGLSTTEKDRTKAFIWRARGGMKPLGGFDRRVGYVEATDINSSGQVVGVYERSDGIYHAFLWHPRNRSVTDLGTLSGRQSGAEAINDNGVVVGSATLADGSERAFMWSPENQRMKPLPNVPVPSSANDVNARGQVVGNYTVLVPCGTDPDEICSQVPQAFLWRPRTETMVTLPTLTLP